MPIDPRIRERRIAVKRDEGRRRLRILVMGVAVVALLGAGYGVTRSPLFDVDKVVVEGATRTPVADVVRVAGLATHPQMADVDPRAVRHRVMRLPWVASADVMRRWPGTVEVRLVERTPAAAVPAAGGGWATVDASGRVVQTGATPPPDLVPVAGVTAPAPGEVVDDRTMDGLRVLEALPASIDARTKGVDVGADATIVVHVDGAPPVLFGPATQVREKLVALTTLLARVDVKGATAIDVRVPTAPVLTHGKP